MASLHQDADYKWLLKAAFMAGWSESGEGYNAEYPCETKAVKRVERQLDAAFKRWFTDARIDGGGDGEACDD